METSRVLAEGIHPCSLHRGCIFFSPLPPHFSSLMAIGHHRKRPIQISKHDRIKRWKTS